MIQSTAATTSSSASKALPVTFANMSNCFNNNHTFEGSSKSIRTWKNGQELYFPLSHWISMKQQNLIPNKKIKLDR